VKVIVRGKLQYICEISSSHSSEYEAQNLLGYTVVFLIELLTDVSEICAASIVRAMSAVYSLITDNSEALMMDCGWLGFILTC
jgi:hypothetical protein